MIKQKGKPNNIISNSLFVLVASIITFYIGFNDIDNSINALKISYDYDLDLFYNVCDQTPIGVCYSYTNMYKLGVALIVASNVTLSTLVIYFIAKFVKEQQGGAEWN